jgi:putative ATP-dependent endonuclease of OLD family
LTAKPLLERPLGQEATNAIRKLFQINRVETAAAVMSECVLVPEGKLDFDWLSLLNRLAELDRQSDEPCLFGVRVGLIPTSDARMRETCETLSKAHSQIFALVDGDEDGDRYAAELRNPDAGARKVLRWPDHWTIEDIVGWIISATEAAVIERLNQDLDVAPDDLATLLTRLKSDNRADYGLKGDLVAYEIIANVLSDHQPCIRRARIMLHALAQACVGEATTRFEVLIQGEVPILVFKPCP